MTRAFLWVSNVLNSFKQDTCFSFLFFLQGVFLKKQKVPNGRGGFLAPSDFQLGRDITIYSHTFHIVGCDVFTKVGTVQSVRVLSKFPCMEFQARGNSVKFQCMKILLVPLVFGTWEASSSALSKFAHAWNFKPRWIAGAHSFVVVRETYHTTPSRAIAVGNGGITTVQLYCGLRYLQRLKVLKLLKPQFIVVHIDCMEMCKGKATNRKHVMGLLN